MNESYVQFDMTALSPSGKTKLWNVSSLMNGEVIGVVKWYAAWRKYAYFPVGESVYDVTCLADISKFLKQETDAHYGKTS
jgi:hypothetical protein